MQRRVVVTGGAGFIGSHLTDALIAQGDAVTVLDDLSGGKRDNVNPAASLVIGDIRNTADVKKAVTGAHVVFHLAAIPRVQRSIEDPVGTGTVNMNGTWNVLCESFAEGVQRFVFASSSSVYGDQPTLPLFEEMRPNPMSPYAMHKWAGELMCGTWNRHSLQAVSLRFFNVYGPRLDPAGPYALVLGKFFAQRLRGEPLTICGDGEQTRDFTHVGDVVRACLLASFQPIRSGIDVFNIGAGRPVSVNRIAELIGGPTVYIPPRPGEPRHTHADTNKARVLLGWEPLVPIEEGIRSLRASMSQA
jgi:nucleoside-diphosphate-sugar epimerase